MHHDCPDKMNLTHTAIATTTGHRGLGMVHGPLGMSPSLGMSPYHSAAAFHARSPFAIHELLGLGPQDMPRPPHIPSLPHDAVLQGSGCLSRSLASPVVTQEACFASSPAAFPAWRSNFMAFGGTHPQNVLNMGVSPYGGIPRPHTDQGSGKHCFVNRFAAEFLQSCSMNCHIICIVSSEYNVY